jgi:hypothetical protein
MEQDATPEDESGICCRGDSAPHPNPLPPGAREFWKALRATFTLTFMMVLASPPIMKDTLRMCRRTGAEVAKVFEGFWTAKANSTRRPSLVPRIAWHSRVAESGQRTLKRAVRLT